MPPIWRKTRIIRRLEPSNNSQTIRTKYPQMPRFELYGIVYHGILQAQLSIFRTSKPKPTLDGKCHLFAKLLFYE